MKQTQTTVERSRWNSLDQDQQELLIKMGFKSASPRAYIKGVKAPTAPDEYYTRIMLTCRLCKSKSMRTFKMAKNGDNSPAHLHALPVESKEYLQASLGDRRTESHTIPACDKCIETLLEKPKLELIKLLMSYSRYTKYN